MSASDEILSKIRNAVTKGDNSQNRTRIVQERIANHPAGIRPYGHSDHTEIRKLFVEKAEAAAASVAICDSGDVERQVLEFLRQHNLPTALRMGDDPRLAEYGIGKDRLLETATGVSEGADEVTLSHAFSGAAETGTLALVSGKDNPTTLNFLGQNHIVILKEEDLLLHQEDIWNKLRDVYGEGKMPRTFNYITGPSRSADIQQTLILGAHGPLRLHIIVVKG